MICGSLQAHLAHVIGVVIHPLHRILVHQPLGGDHGFLRADRPYGEDDDVITHAVVPRVRQVQDAHRAEVGVLDPAHQLLAGLLAVHGHRHSALEQRHAYDAVKHPSPSRSVLTDRQLLPQVSATPFVWLTQLFVGATVFEDFFEAARVTGPSSLRSTAFA